MILYHGSKSKFEKFDLKKIGSLNGTSEGKGFYFTNNKQIASGYAENGFLYTINFKGKKSLSNDKKKLTRKQYEKLILELDQKGEYLSNFGEKEYEGLENVLAYAMEDYNNCDDDSELLGSIINAYGSSVDVLESVYNLFSYDHIYIEKAEWGNQTIVVALTPNCFEIVSVEEMKKTETV